MKSKDQHKIDQFETWTRRQFLNTTASGIGMAALGSMLSQDGLLAASAEDSTSREADIVTPLAPRDPHFPPQGQGLHFHFHGRRSIANRPVR